MSRVIAASSPTVAADADPLDPEVAVLLGDLAVAQGGVDHVRRTVTVAVLHPGLRVTVEHALRLVATRSS